MKKYLKDFVIVLISLVVLVGRIIFIIKMFNNPLISILEKIVQISLEATILIPIFYMLSTKVSFFNKIKQMIIIRKTPFELISKVVLTVDNVNMVKLRDDLKNRMIAEGIIISDSSITHANEIISFTYIMKNNLSKKFEITKYEQTIHVSFYSSYIYTKEIEDYIRDIQFTIDNIKKHVNNSKEVYHLSFKFPENKNPYIKYYMDFDKSVQTNLTLSNNTQMNNDVVNIRANESIMLLKEFKERLYKL